MIKRTPAEWLKQPEFEGIIILDPDGWRRADAPSFDTAIDEREFTDRLVQSTCKFPSEFFR
jgi:hypothetical protein